MTNLARLERSATRPHARGAEPRTGTCGPSYPGTGQAGYDGPTGLGTPNGAGAF